MQNTDPTARGEPLAPYPEPARQHPAYPDSPTSIVLLALLIAYFALHVASRVLISDALELDEAEQAIWTQQLALGYGAQPPLYTWLQWGVFKLLGVSVLSLSLLKNTLLALTYVFVWLTARRIVAPPLAALSAACMLLVPQIGWESQRDLTHSVLVTTMAAATLCIVVHLIREQRPSLYIALGFTAGLGMLSKYSFLVFLTALALAALTTREARSAWRNRWLLASVLVAGLVLLPHAVWLLDHWEMASTRTLEKLNAAPGVFEGFGRGLVSLANAFLATLAALALVLILIFGRAAWQSKGAGPFCGFWRRYMLALLTLMLAMVFIGGASHFKGRWLQPLLFAAPLMVFCCRPALLAHPRLHWLRNTLIAIGLTYLALLSLRPAFDGWRDRPDELNEPAVELASALTAAGYDGLTPIVTHESVLGGVLRMRFPRAPVFVWKDGTPAPAALHGPHLLIGRENAGAALFERAGNDNATTFALAFRHARPDHPPIQYRYALNRVATRQPSQVQSRPPAP